MVFSIAVTNLHLADTLFLSQLVHLQFYIWVFMYEKQNSILPLTLMLSLGRNIHWADRHNQC